MKFWKEKEPDWRMSSPVFSKHCPVSRSSLCRAASVIIKRTWNKAQGPECESRQHGIPPSGQGWPLDCFRFITSKNHSFPGIQISPGALDRAHDRGHQLASEHHFPSLATTKTVAVVDFLSLVSLSFSNQSAQLAIVCSTAVSAGSMWSKRLMNISQTESPSTVQVPQLLLPQETEISNSVRPSYLESLSFQATHQTHSSKCGLGWYQRWDQPGVNVEHKQKAACP